MRLWGVLSSPRFLPPTPLALRFLRPTPPPGPPCGGPGGRGGAGEAGRKILGRGGAYRAHAGLPTVQAGEPGGIPFCHAPPVLPGPRAPLLPGPSPLPPRQSPDRRRRPGPGHHHPREDDCCPEPCRCPACRIPGTAGGRQVGPGSDGARVRSRNLFPGSPGPARPPPPGPALWGRHLKGPDAGGAGPGSVGVRITCCPVPHTARPRRCPVFAGPGSGGDRGVRSATLPV